MNRKTNLDASSTKGVRMFRRRTPGPPFRRITMTNEYYPEQRGGHSLAAFIMGAAVGAVIALLYAPASGAETRSKMKKLSKDAAREAKRRFEQGRAKFQQAVAEGAETLEAELGGESKSRQSYAQPQEDKYDH